MAKYLAIKDNDIDNGPGLRVSVWFSGCPHKCRGCHNPESWDETQGKEFGNDTIDYIINLLEQDGIVQGLSILGGEPLAPYNIDATIDLISEVRKRKPNTSIYLWTGYEIEQIHEIYEAHGIPTMEHSLLGYNRTYDNILELLDVDVIIDGKYSELLKVNDKLRGSSNQRIIKHRESLKSGKVIFA